LLVLDRDAAPVDSEKLLENFAGEFVKITSQAEAECAFGTFSAAPAPPSAGAPSVLFLW
jgi:hypothetical protein